MNTAGLVTAGLVTGSSLKVFRGEVGDVIPRVPVEALLQSALVQVVT